MSTLNICFYGELMKIILQLPSNTLLICSTVTGAKDTTYDGICAKFSIIKLNWHCLLTEI